MTATHTRYIPVPVLNVAAETPLSLQGDTADRPRPAPKAIRRSVSAAAPTAPAAIAPHDRPDCASTIVDSARRSVFICILPAALKGSAQQFGSIKKVPAALETPLTGPFPTTHAVKEPGGGRALRTQ